MHAMLQKAGHCNTNLLTACVAVSTLNHIPYLYIYNYIQNLKKCQYYEFFLQYSLKNLILNLIFRPI